MRIQPAHRFQDRYRRMKIRDVITAPEPQCARDGQQMVCNAATDKNRGSHSQKSHCAMKKTPIRIRATPAQRRQSTASFSSTFASKVSGINVAADMGTAKL